MEDAFHHDLCLLTGARASESSRHFRAALFKKEKCVGATYAKLSAEFDPQLSCVGRAKMAKTKDDPVVEDVDDDEESDDDSDDVPELEEAPDAASSRRWRKSRGLFCIVSCSE